ncbi:hypothetical protein EYF80_010234 [Liparis tanakae]|uniref:Uncharacterized protein n=1 Tax=Liparis tanakae TaxID=230148 RepID=A0A4Z2IMZ3_9TELE|nr:hypothetical protein EYF80_010234 [Liparis tanakae]
MRVCGEAAKTRADFAVSPERAAIHASTDSETKRSRTYFPLRKVLHTGKQKPIAEGPHGRQTGGKTLPFYTAAPPSSPDYRDLSVKVSQRQSDLAAAVPRDGKMKRSTCKMRFQIKSHPISGSCDADHIRELLLDSSKLRDRVTVPLPKLTLGLCFPDVASHSLALRLMDEDGVEAEDPPMLPDFFLAAVLCFSVAFAATLKAWAAVMKMISSMS